MWVSMRVASLAFVLTFLIGIPIGIYAAVKRGTWIDPLLISNFLLLHSIPALVLVPFLVLLLSVKLDLVPSGGFDGIFSASMVIPTIAMTLPGISGVARLARTATLAALYEDFVRTARAKGLAESTVVSRHIARHSVVPLMTTVIGLSLVGLIEGAIIIETILGIPGIGLFIFQSVKGQDYNVILAVVMITTAALVVANLLVDVALIAIDPRIRSGGRDLR
jgi:ABC-type dipeptide/oligopeptide/nickel transport system permease component